MKKKSKILSLLFFIGISSAIGQIANLTVDAGSTDRYETPVSICLEGLTSLPEDNLVLYEWSNKNEKTAVPFQIETYPYGRVLSWVLSGDTPAKKKRKFSLEQGKALEFPTIIGFVKNEESLLVCSGEDKIFTYHFGEKQAPKGKLNEYRRSGFIHPLWSPDGTVLTDIQPSDHPHHYGIMNPWTKTTFEGKVVDFWNLQKGEGTVRFKTFSSMVKGAVFGGFEAIQEHIVFKPGYEKVALNEHLQVKAWNVKNNESRKVWLLDYVSTENCASDSALLLNEYRYGGILFRGTPEWTNETSEILTSEGKTRVDADDSLARWMLCSGKTGTGNSTFLMLSYPTNYNHPEPVRVWPEKSKYIFMNFSPTKNKDWLLLPGKDYTRKYRLVIVEGKLSAEQAEQYWQDYANPPLVSIRK